MEGRFRGTAGPHRRAQAQQQTRRGERACACVRGGGERVGSSGRGEAVVASVGEGRPSAGLVWAVEDGGRGIGWLEGRTKQVQLRAAYS